MAGTRRSEAGRARRLSRRGQARPGMRPVRGLSRGNKKALDHVARVALSISLPGNKG